MIKDNKTPEEHAAPQGRRRLAGRFADAIVSPIIGAVDVDSVVEQVDIETLIERIDINELLGRVDIEALLARIDIAAIIDQVDINELVGRVDIQAIIERVDIAALIAQVDIQSIIDQLDMDALLERVDVAKLIERIDIDELINGIDVAALIDRVDIQAVINMIDIDEVLESVDMNALLRRTELGAIVARSTTGIFGELLDVARGIVVIIDLVIHETVGRVLRPRTEKRPGRPGRLDDVIETRSMTRSDRAVALQGHFAGPMSRLLAFITDQFMIGLMFTGAQYLFTMALAVVTGTSWDPSDHRMITAVLYLCWSFFYFAAPLAALGRTLGMAIVGLLVVRADGSPLRTRDAVIRTIALPFSFAIFGVGLLVGLVRRDRRQLQDLMAGSAVIYAWDAQLARLREAPVQS